MDMWNATAAELATLKQQEPSVLLQRNKRCLRRGTCFPRLRCLRYEIPSQYFHISSGVSNLISSKSFRRYRPMSAMRTRRPQFGPAV